MLLNYQYGKRSVNTCNTDDINELDASFSTDARKPQSYLKGLKMEIDETFRRYKAKEHTFGKAFREAARHGESGKDRGEDFKIESLLPRSLPHCKPAPFLLILIHSTPANFMEREAIRLSWGSQQNSINRANKGTQLIPSFGLWKTVFLLGQTQNPKLDDLLQKEANVYNDIVFGKFIDSYRNLTRKMVLGIEWAAKNCQAKYVMKADEDSFINILELVQWLKEYQRMQAHKPLYMGAALIDKGPYREKDSQFYVSEEEYPKPTYPPYVSGTGYVFSGKLLVKLSNSLKAVRLFPNEDACFGVLMQYIKVKPLNNERFIPFTMQIATYDQRDGYSLLKAVNEIEGYQELSFDDVNLGEVKADPVCRDLLPENLSALLIRGQKTFLFGVDDRTDASLLYHDQTEDRANKI
ncbi:hypothetical protein ACROYT_G019179 [Oculina patagonica]